MPNFSPTMRVLEAMAIPTFTLVATMRNEGPYILEWVAYHRLIGFTDLVLCSNDCVDGTPDLLEALDRHGLITHLPCEPGPGDKPQLFAYAQAETVLSRRGADWLMVLDADEFLNVHVGDGKVGDLVAAAPSATAFLLNWRIFGSSGHRCWSPEPVITRFTRAALRESAVNLSYKTLFTRADAYHCMLLPHGPGHAREERLGELRPVDGEGAPLPERYARSEGFLQSEPDRVSWRLAQVNHYNTRSWDDYLAKHDRGGGLTSERWDRDWNWTAFNRNEAEDRTIQRHRPGLQASMQRLLGEPEIAAAYAQCLDRYGDHVARLARESA